MGPAIGSDQTARGRQGRSGAKRILFPIEMQRHRILPQNSPFSLVQKNNTRENISTGGFLPRAGIPLEEVQKLDLFPTAPVRILPIEDFHNRGFSIGCPAFHPASSGPVRKI